MTEDEIRLMATRFLDGAITEAAHLIGTGDPFGYRLSNRGSEASLGSDDRHSLESDDQDEYGLMDHLVDDGNAFATTIDYFIETSAKLAASTKINAEVHRVTVSCIYNFLRA